MKETEKYLQVIDNYINELVALKNPVNLYEPIQYIVSLGGKKVRPTLTLLTCDILKTDYNKAIHAAIALELFHNFSLIHDDIMDQAPIRRGKITVHEKWGMNTGILSGDALLILAYQLFENYPPKMFQEMAELFSKTALQVCEGQQYDIDFESSDQVSIEDYIKMIDYKTAVLLGASMKMGAIVAQESEECKNNFYEFGRHLGIAYQLQDDYLDAFGNSSSFGKHIGGDIISNKKTFLYLKALQNSNQNDSKKLINLFSKTPTNQDQKVKEVLSIYRDSGMIEATSSEIKKYTDLANSYLQTIPISDEDKQILYNYGQVLMGREF